MGEERRYARFLLDPEVFAAFCCTGPNECLRCLRDPLPPDARFVSAMYDFERRAFGVIVESQQFEPVPFGQMLPLITAPVFTLARYQAPPPTGD